MLRDHHLKQMKNMGYDTYSKSYEDVVDEMIYEIIELRRRDVETEYDRFQRELNRITKPTN
jgi:hypothetical protein